MDADNAHDEFAVGGIERPGKICGQLPVCEELHVSQHCRRLDVGIGEVDGLTGGGLAHVAENNAANFGTFTVTAATYLLARRS